MCRSVELRLREQQVSGNASPVPLATYRMESTGSGRVMNQGRKLTCGLVFVCCNPKVTMQLLKTVFGNGQGVQRNRLTKFVNLLAEMQRVHTASKAVSLMTEQGVLQGVWSLEMLASESVCKDIMELIVPWLPDAIVLVKAESSQLEKRLAFRKLGQSTFDQLRGAELTLAIKRGEDKLARIIDIWTSLKPGGRRLDFTNETDNDAGELYAWLVNQLAGN